MAVRGVLRNLCVAAVVAVVMPIWAHGQSYEQSAGIYYAYPGPQSEQTPAPAGFGPVYVSHYGRHGSRWITDDYRYLDCLAPLDSAYEADNLTPIGAEVRERLQRIVSDALGRSGSLSPVGERQHRDIADRMYHSYPEVFAAGNSIEAVSSTSMRCAMSMFSFLERLKELEPSLQVTRTAHAKDMSYIAHTTAEGKAFSADTAAWRAQHMQYTASQVRPQRLMDALFIDPSALSETEQRKLMMDLYWIACDMQDVEVGETLYDVFTLDELQGCWRTINARMYICNGDAPLAQGVMKHCADNLLSDIIVKADAALSAGAPCANLRFGHDTHLLRLLARMGIEGCCGQETDMEKFHEVWRDYELSPMAANLQLVFYRNASGEILVKLLLNENEVRLPIESYSGLYYRWESVKNSWK